MFFKKRDTKTWDAVSRASLMGTNMVASTLVGLALGYYLDKWLDTSPWMLIVWLVLGIVAGFRSMYLETMRINRAQDGAAHEAHTGERGGEADAGVATGEGLPGSRPGDGGKRP